MLKATQKNFRLLPNLSKNQTLTFYNVKSPLLSQRFLTSSNVFFRTNFLFHSQERAGEKYRLSLGKGRSGNEDGPIHDLPDWEYAGFIFFVLIKNNLFFFVI